MNTEDKTTEGVANNEELNVVDETAKVEVGDESGEESLDTNTEDLTPGAEVNEISTPDVEDESNLPEPEVTEEVVEEEEEKVSTTVPVSKMSFMGYEVLSFDEVVINDRVMVKAKVMDTHGQEQEMTVLKQEFDEKSVFNQ